MQCSVLLFLSIAVIAADDFPQGVSNSQNPADVSLSPQESLARITVPDGFNVTLFAGEPDIRRPIAFDFDDRGRLWVVENYSHPTWTKDNATDRIVILEDTDNDGKFDKRKLFYDTGRYLTGIALGHGGVWIANTPELSFIPDRNHDDVPDNNPEVMLDGFQISTNNVVNNFHWGPDGWLYGAIGLSSKSLVGKPGTPEDQRVPITRGIWRFHPVTHVFEKVAEGMVNPWGADFNAYGDLITANTVIAHLWHIVPGMYCERRANERGNPYAYGRIQTIANHLHWGGGGWQSSRAPANQKAPKNKEEANHDHDDGYQQHSVAGGGHAHCGAMIYLGDNWPDDYRGAFFTNNLHGSRVNHDRLVPKRSTYVGEHAKDLLFGNDPWFRGMSIKYGPDGGVYVSDWHDFGECHDSDGSHRSSGRIYKFVFGTTAKPQTHLQDKSSFELADLHLHRNEWFVRHARRILHERSVAGEDVSKAVERLQTILADHKDETKQLSAMWTLSCLREQDEADLLGLLTHDSEHIRRWAVRFLVDHLPCDTSPGTQNETLLADVTISRFTEMALRDSSAKVRLELACALQRIPHDHRLAIATALTSHSEDATDSYLPLMIWYGLEPAVSTNPDQSLQLAVKSEIPLIRQYIARRLIDQTSPAIPRVVAAASMQTEESIRHDLLRGMLQALDGLGNQQPPATWKKLYAETSTAADSGLRSTAVRLATIFGDKLAIRNLQQTAMDDNAADTDRREALKSLLQLDDGASVDMLHRLVQTNSVLRRDAILALSVRNSPATAGILLNHFAELPPEQKQDVVGVLATRRTFADALLDAIEASQVGRGDVSAYALQQLRAFNVEKLQQRISVIWADDTASLKKSDEIAEYQQRMSPSFLSHGSATAGRLVFERTCAKCHALFGEGGSIAPDLTGSGRKKPDYVLRNLIDPSADIDAAYRLTTVLTTDGRLFNGFMVHQDDKWLNVRTQDANIRLAMNDVDELVKSNVSMMPEGLLRSFTDQQIRDLLIYLASDDQVSLPTDVD